MCEMNSLPSSRLADLQVISLESHRSHLVGLSRSFINEFEFEFESKLLHHRLLDQHRA